MKYNKSLPKDRRRKVFERVVNPLLIKYLILKQNPKYQGRCIAANIPIKYLSYFKEVSSSRRAKKLRYRYRGKSKLAKLGNGRYAYTYKRPQSFCHMDFADTFSLYYR